MVSLTSALRAQLVKCFYDFINKYTDIFVEKMREACALQKFLTIFHKKYWHIWDINVWNFNVSITNDVVSFEQPGRNL